MKLLCSLLILAGVFALNESSISYEDQMRLENDQLLLEELKYMAMNRDANSLACSQKLMDDLSKALGDFNEKLKICNQTKEEAIKEITAAATNVIIELGADLQGTCDALSKCGSLESAIDSLACLQEESSESAKTCTNVSNDASTAQVQMRRDIETCEGNESICNNKAMSEYSSESQKINSAFTDCVNGKKSDGEKPSPTEAPKEPSSTPAEEKDEEVAGEGEGGDRRPRTINKFQRF